MDEEAKQSARPISGVGIGLRACHFSYVLENKPDIAWFEALSDNYLGSEGAAIQHLDVVRQHYPVALHGVGLSIGSTDPLNQQYLSTLKTLADRIQPEIISDHLCWISTDKHYLHDLLPLPYTTETVKHVTERIQQVQEFLGRQILIENVSSYLSYADSEMTEWDFLNEIATQADCHLLLDINNVYVNAINHEFDPNDYIDSVLPERVKQFHLAGFTDKGTHLLDTHSAPVYDKVWTLYEHALQKFGAVPTLIEWDLEIPEFPVLMQEADKAKQRMAKVTK